MAQEIDLSQFHAIFFEECSEGIEAMESGLLNLGIGETGTEMVNTIFRAAHSIKVVQELLDSPTFQNLLMAWKPCWMRCGKVDAQLQKMPSHYYLRVLIASGI